MFGWRITLPVVCGSRLKFRFSLVFLRIVQIVQDSRERRLIQLASYDAKKVHRTYKILSKGAGKAIGQFFLKFTS